MPTNSLSAWTRIITCIVCDQPDPKTVEFVKKRHLLLRQHLKHWNSGFEFLPVLYVLETQEVYYWADFDLTGSAV